MRHLSKGMMGFLVLFCLTSIQSSAQSKLADQVVVGSVTDTMYNAVGGVATDRAGFIYVADFNETVWKITPWGEKKVLANSLYGASGNAIDRYGNLFQSNFYGNTVSKIMRDGTVTTYASTGLNGPVGIAINPQGELFVCNCNVNSISKIAPDGTVATFSQGNLFRCPNGISYGPDGNLYVVNYSDPAMIRITPDGNATHFATIPGGGNGHITVAKGNFYVTSFQGHQIFLVSSDGNVQLLAGTGEKGEKDGAHDEARFSQPNGIAASFNGTTLYTNDLIKRGNNQGPSQSIVRSITIPDLTAVVANALNTGDISAAREAYLSYKNDPIFGAANTEAVMNFLGYQLMGQGKIQQAIAIFEMNVESYPKSWNVFDSLGEAYKNAGNIREAILNYKKSIELNPDNTNGAEILKALQEGNSE